MNMTPRKTVYNKSKTLYVQPLKSTIKSGQYMEQRFITSDVQDSSTDETGKLLIKNETLLSLDPNQLVESYKTDKLRVSSERGNFDTSNDLTPRFNSSAIIIKGRFYLKKNVLMYRKKIKKIYILY